MRCSNHNHYSALRERTPTTIESAVLLFSPNGPFRSNRKNKSLPFTVRNNDSLVQHVTDLILTRIVSSIKFCHDLISVSFSFSLSLCSMRISNIVCHICVWYAARYTDVSLRLSFLFCTNSLIVPSIETHAVYGASSIQNKTRSNRTESTVSPSLFAARLRNWHISICRETISFSRISIVSIPKRMKKKNMFHSIEWCSLVTLWWTQSVYEVNDWVLFFCWCCCCCFFLDPQIFASEKNWINKIAYWSQLFQLVALFGVHGN